MCFHTISDKVFSGTFDLLLQTMFSINTSQLFLLRENMVIWIPRSFLMVKQLNNITVFVYFLSNFG